MEIKNWSKNIGVGVVKNGCGDWNWQYLKMELME